MVFKPGPDPNRCHGRKKGSKNKVTRKRNMDEAKEAEKRQEAIDSDEMPLKFMLKNMRDPANDLQFRAQMAARAAPFCHPQLPPGDRAQAPGCRRQRDRTCGQRTDHGSPARGAQ